jgi:hypothetical protein
MSATGMHHAAIFGAVVNSSPKYRNAMAVRSVTGGQVMNALTVIGIQNEPLKAALESSLAANGYLARSGTPRFQDSMSTPKF